MTEPVATREGGVDRNSLALAVKEWEDVATREGGVDRNDPRSQLLYGWQ